MGIELYNSGELEKHSVKVLGTPVPTIIDTEDREKFGNMMKEIGETVALSYPATSIATALEAANKIGYPVLVRAAFALGGMGSGFAENDEELTRFVLRAMYNLISDFAASFAALCMAISTCQNIAILIDTLRGVRNVASRE